MRRTSHSPNKPASPAFSSPKACFVGFCGRFDQPGTASAVPPCVGQIRFCEAVEEPIRAAHTPLEPRDVQRGGLRPAFLVLA